MSYMYHDSAACLVRDGEVVAAAAEERFLRIKHTVDFPVRALEYVLAEGGIGVDDLDAIVFYEKPFLKFERILKSHLMVWPRSYASFRRFLPMWLNYKLRVPQIIRQQTGYQGKIYFSDHHYAHAASAFLPSGFDKAIVLTMDGTGEWSTLAMGVAEGTRIRLDRDVRFPHSIGLLYSSVTAHLGFKVNGGEGKVMGLASYGEPRFADQLRKVFRVFDDGSFQLDLDHFSFHYDLVMTNERFAALTIPPRTPESELRQEHKDLAASLQLVVEEAILQLVKHAHATYGLTDLCIAGGVGLNCVANGRILRDTPIERIFVQPASGDDGGALGSALHVYSALLGGTERPRMEHAYLGPSYDDAAIEALLAEVGADYVRLDDEELVDHVAGLIERGLVVGWFQGRMEYGPRALGNRSILADPRDPGMKDRLNARVKFRESFRPFAPAVPLDDAGTYFDTTHPSPFMLLAVPVKPEAQAILPSITHVDGTARLQTVTPTSNPRFHDLLQAFGRRTGVPVLLNTSFNLRGEPIVCTPQEAWACYARTGMDALVLGRYVITKPEEA
ncbi:MAG: carbamoyltransferase [Alphaproteobacteria bacterium]|nr:carbamoyltransferase [Alphaproteobacteria bacterium]